MNATAAPATETVELLTYTDPFPGRNGAEQIFEACDRCGGTGGIQHYGHIDGGICYGCEGGKGKYVSIKNLRNREQRRVRTENKRRTEQVVRVARHAANVTAALTVSPEAARWEALTDESGFLYDLWIKAYDYELTEKQVAAVADACQRQADHEAGRKAEADAAQPVKEGRYELTGEVAMVKYYENTYSYSGAGQWKMIVKANDSKVFVSVPQALIEALDAETGTNRSVTELKGRTVTLTVTVEASADDKAFGFGKRPTKPALAPAE